MNKLFTKIAALVLGMTMAVGVGVAVGGGVKASEADATDTKVSFKTGSNSVAIKVNWNSAGAPSSNNGVRIGTSGSTGSATFVIPSGTTKFGFYAVGWNAKATTASVSASVGTISTSTASLTSNSAASGTISADATVAITETETNAKKEFSISNVTESSTITLTTSGSNKRLIAWDAYYVTEDKTLSSIAVTKSPTKTTYYVGDSFDSTGMTVTATYSDSSTVDVTTSCTFSPATFTTTGNQNVTVSYTEGGVTKTTTQAVTVNAARTMQSISLHGTIEKDEYYVGDLWDLTGLDIQVNWSEGDPTYVEFDDEEVDYECKPATADVTTRTSFDIDVTYRDIFETFTVEGITISEAPLEYEVVFGTADGAAGLSDFNNTSYIIPSGVTLDNIQGNLYGKNDDTAAAIRFGKSGTTGSFDATISDDYYITSVKCNLKYYGSDSTAEFAVTPDGGEAIAKTLTSSFADYTYTIEGIQTNKITLGTTISGKRAYLSAFTICYAEYTDASITITSKDSSGMMSGIIGDIKEVTYETARAEGLTLNWVLEDTDNIIDWETPYVEFLKTGSDATLTAQLKNGDEVLASDSVTFHTIAPLLDIKVDGTSSESYSLYEEQSITITADSSNMPSSATLVWSTDDTDEDYSTFNTSTGLFEAISEGIVEIKVDMMYKSSVIASDKLTITINPLGEPTLVVTTGSGLTSFKFGESLDTTGWTAIYTDDKGVQTDVINDLDFGSLDYIGTKALKATYLGTESNAVNVTVTNNGATCEPETILEGTGFLSNSMPTGWSQSGGSDYAESHSPYRLKFDGDGDKITATVNTSASVIYATLGVKMIGGASTSSFAVTAKDSNGNSVATGTLTIAGKQNEIVNPKTTLNNPEGKTITSIEFVFTKGSNVGVGTGEISVDDSSSFAPKQALAYSRYFLELTDGYCDATISSDAKTALINEFNWMLADSIDVFKAAPIVRGKGVTYESDISKALSRYINMLEDKGYKDSEFLNLGEDVINRTSVIHNGIFGFDNDSNNAIAIVVIVSVVSLTAIGGYFFLRKKREQN